MRFVQCLSRLSVERLRAIAAFAGLKPESLSKQRLLSAINARYLQPAVVAALWGALREEQQLLLAFLLRQRIQTADWDLLAREVAAWCCRGDIQDAHQRLEELCDTGLLIRLADRDTAQAVMAEDLAPLLRDVLAKDDRSAGLAPVAAPAVVHPGRPVLSRNLFHLAALVARQRLRLTKQTQLFRRLRERIGAIFLPMELPGLIAHPDSIDNDFPRGPDLLVTLGVESELLRVRDGGLQVDPRVRAFVQLDDSAAARAIYETFARVFVARDLHLAHAQSLLAETAVSGGWHLVGAMATQAVRPVGGAAGRENASLHAKIEWYVQALWAMGMLDLGLDGGAWSLRVTPLGRYVLTDGEPPPRETPGPITLLPDFRLIVAATVPLEQLWHIERFADLENCDVVLSYTITKSSIYRALRWGDTTEEILARLESWTGKSLSQNVRYTIASWGESFGRLEFIDALLLRCDSKELAEELRAVPEIARCVRGMVPPCHLIIERAAYPQLLALLEQLGYLPKPLRDDTFDALGPAAP